MWHFLHRGKKGGWEKMARSLTTTKFTAVYLLGSKTIIWKDLYESLKVVFYGVFAFLSHFVSGVNNFLLKNHIAVSNVAGPSCLPAKNAVQKG